MAAITESGTPIAIDGSRKTRRSLTKARILILGIAYKKNVDDMRESPALTLIEMLEGQGAKVDYHDPIIATIKPSREHPHLAGRRSIALSDTNLKRADVVLIVTDHDAIDFKRVGKTAKLIVDTRNTMARAGWRGRNVIKA